MRKRANNKIIRRLIEYVKDDLDCIDGEVIRASKRHVKPREKQIDDYTNHIEFLLKGIKSEFKFNKKTENEY